MKRSKDKFTWKMYTRLFVPSLLSSFGLAFADMADALVLGQRMGATGLAAISLALPVYMVINVLMHGFGAGGSVKYSALLGEGKKSDALKVFNSTVYIALALSVVLAVLGNIFIVPLLRVLGTVPADGELYKASYEYVQIIISGIPLFFLTYILNYFLRNDDNQKLASAAFIVGNITDITLNIVFVLIFDLGVKGAAWSTLIGYTLSTLLYLPGFFSKNHTLRFKLIRPEFKKAAASFKTGFSTSSEYLMHMIFLIVANNALMNMNGEVGVAIFDMIQNASFFIIYLYDSAGKALQPLASTYYGEHNNEGKTRSIKYALLSGSAAGIIVSVIIALLPSLVCRLFGLSGDGVIEMGSYALRIYCLSAVFAGISIILQTYFQSCNQEKSAFLLILLRSAIILLPITFLFSVIGNQELFWWLYPITEVISLAVILLLYKKLKTQDIDESRIMSRTIMNKNSDVGELTAQVEEFCEKWDATPKQTYFVTMTLEEICLAIMLNAFDTTEDGFIQVTLIALEDGVFELHIRDNATAFDPFSLLNDDEDEFDIESAGMRVIKKKAKDFFYRRYQGFNALVVKV